METNGTARRGVITIKESVIIARCNEFCLIDKKRAAQVIPSSHVIATLAQKHRTVIGIVMKNTVRARTQRESDCEIETVARSAHKTVAEKGKSSTAHCPSISFFAKPDFSTW